MLLKLNLLHKYFLVPYLITLYLMSIRGIAAKPPQEAVYSQNNLLIVYPKEGSSINTKSTFIIGSTTPSTQLACNGILIKLNKEGFFAHVTKLVPGKNQLSLLHDGQEFKLTLFCPPQPLPLPKHPLKILPESIKPNEDMGVSPGDIIQFALRATPQAKVYVKISNRIISLNASRNPEFDTVDGINHKAAKDFYTGFYKIAPQDNWVKARPLFVLQKEHSILKHQANARLTVMHQPQIVRCLHEDTTVRWGAELARTTPLAQGVRLLCNGFTGNWSRLELCPTKHVWIQKDDLGTDKGCLPFAQVKTLNFGSDSYGACIHIPLSQRLPYQIEQELKPSRIILRIFGASSDTDFVTSDISLQTSHSLAGALIDRLHWRQKEDSVYELIINLKHKEQWGFYANYEGNSLVLHIKAPPPITPEANSLTGTTICLDPGHGGQEAGSIGCSGIKESNLNLIIAQKLKNKLENLGARVVMTRTKDTDVSLSQRVSIAEKAKADILLSLHNNALPDGQDPLTEHGSASYWYHPQSMALARSIKDSLIKATGFPDYGTHYQSLALCRPSQMLAVLIEAGFMINPDEYSQLIKEEVQEKIANAIAQALKTYLAESTE